MQTRIAWRLFTSFDSFSRRAPNKSEIWRRNPSALQHRAHHPDPGGPIARGWPARVDRAALEFHPPLLPACDKLPRMTTRALHQWLYRTVLTKPAAQWVNYRD